MDELEKALGLQEGLLAGPEREKALADFQAHIRSWDLALPNVEPLVWDFGLRDFHRTGLIECWIANETRAGYCAKLLFLFDGQTCPKHLHRHKTETFFAVKGTTRIFCDGSIVEIRPGHTFLVGPGRTHSLTGIGPTLVLEVSTPCTVDDNFFEDPRVPYGGNYRKGAE